MKVMLGEKILISNLEVADDFSARLTGLMFRKSMLKEQAMMIPKCNWVHTLFMRFPIDVVYLDDGYKICSIDANVKPWRFCKPRLKAKHVLELYQGAAETFLLKEGEILKCIS